VAILVTGGAGFVGWNVVEALLGGGEAVVVFDRGALPAAAQPLVKARKSQLTVFPGDVLDVKHVDLVFERHPVERVVHAAAVTSGPSREAGDPGGVVDVNLQGTINVLAAARRNRVQRVVHVSSGAAYGESLYRLPRLYEEDPSVPTTLYSITKHAAERMCLRLRALWELDIVCARLGTVIGPWERVTDARDNYGTHTQLAALAVAGKPAILPAREVRRDWVYSRDVAAGLVALLKAGRPRHPLYNLSSGVEWEAPIARWCELLKTAFPGFTYRAAAEGEEPNVWYTDRDRCIMDIGRLEQDLQFRIGYPMAAAYADYLEWMRSNESFFVKA
jgi:UDP-glucose 4-epimerase